MSFAENLEDTMKTLLEGVYTEGKSAGDNEGYSRGLGEGYTAGYDEGFEAGKAVSGNSYYDTFWDEVQDKGARTDYTYGFCHSTWTDAIFKPKYDIKPTRMNYMFTQSNITTLKDVNIDFSEVSGSHLIRPFDGSAIKYIGDIDISHLPSPNINTLFANATALVTVNLLKVSESGTVVFTDSTFSGCGNLANITFDGLLDSDINMSACPLTTASLQSIIDNMATATSTNKRTLTLSDAAKANLTDTQRAAANSKNWEIK